MRIQVELLGGLRTRMPRDGQLHLADNTRLGDLLAALSLSSREVQAIWVNSRLEYDQQRRLCANDTVKVLPYTFAHAGTISDDDG